MAISVTIVRDRAALHRHLRPYRAVLGDFCLGTFITRLQVGREVRLRVRYTAAERTMHNAALGILATATRGLVDFKIEAIENNPSGACVDMWIFTRRQFAM